MKLIFGYDDIETGALTLRGNEFVLEDYQDGSRQVIPAAQQPLREGDVDDLGAVTGNLAIIRHYQRWGLAGEPLMHVLSERLQGRTWARLEEDAKVQPATNSNEWQPL